MTRSTFRGIPGPRFGFFSEGKPECDRRYDRGSGPSARAKKLIHVFSNFTSSEKKIVMLN